MLLPIYSSRMILFYSVKLTLLLVKQSLKLSMSFVPCLVKLLVLINPRCLSPLTYPINKALRLSNSCRIALTNDLGKYLGVPILYSRANKDHFKHIIERVQNKLAGWKANTLMLAGRATLIQASSATIPSYTMQTMNLPVNVCDKLDRINKDFLWGDTPDKRKLHLVNWHTVCKDNDVGGLGLRKAQIQNTALLTKLGWKIVSQDNSLWANILRDKYLKNHTFQSWPTNRSASHIWRSIIHARDVIKDGTKWTISDGLSVDLWNDWWCRNGPLAKRHHGPHTKENIKVAAIIENGQWNLDAIGSIVDDLTRDDILAIVLPIYSQDIGHPSWVESPNGNCSASMAYNFINRDSSDTKGWRWLWKLNIPQKLKTFLWLIFHNN